MEIVKSWQSCIGTISDGSESWDIQCEIQCSTKGQLSVLLEDVPLNDSTFRLYNAAHGSNPAVLPYLKIECIAPDGTRLISDHIYITELGLPSNTEGAWVHLKGKAARIEAMISPCDSASKATLVYHTLGMLGFHEIIKEYNDLTLKVEAPNDVQDFDGISGAVWMQGRIVEALDSWIEKRDKNTDTLLRLVSFGQGRIVRWTIRKLYVDDKLASILFVGPNSSPEGIEPPFSHLHMEPLIDLAISRFDKGLDQPRNLSVAMEWLAISSTFPEVKFLNAVSAFESLLAGNNKEDSMLPSNEFQSVIREPIETLLSKSKDSIIKALKKDNVSNLSTEEADKKADDILDKIQKKLGQLNHPSLLDRINALLKHFDVPLDDLPLSVKKLLQTRNKIVHGGKIPNQKYSITEQAVMMREVLRRTILAMLNFEGQFCSYLNGAEWLTFRAPPTKRA